MKILLASPYRGVPGGISRWTEHILNYYNSTDDEEVDLTLLEMNRSVFVDIDSNLWFRIASGLKDYRNIVKDFKASILQEHFDVLHLVSSASISLTKDIYMLRLAKKHSLKTVIHFHFGRIPGIAAKNNWEWKLLQKVVRLADKAVVIDRFSYDTLTGRGFDNVVMLPNPIAPAVNEIIGKNEDVERKPGTVLFTRVWPLPVTWVWAFTACVGFLDAMLFLWRFRSGHWRKIRLIERRSTETPLEELARQNP